MANISSSIQQYFKKFWQETSFAEKIGIFFILQFAIFAPFIASSGYDFYSTFRVATLTGAYGQSTWNPYPAYWLLTPFSLLPPQIGFLLWNLLAAVGFIAAIRHLDGRFLPFALSLPCFWLLYVGQFEGVVALGLALGMVAPPLWAGLGLVLLSLKPQIGLFAIVFILLQRRDVKLLIIPGAVYLLSLLYWGWWLPEWLDSIIGNRATGYAANISLWPYSIVLLPLLFFKRASLRLWLVVQSLVVPYFAAYSLAILYTMWLPLWANLLTWGLYILGIFLPVKMPGFIIPLGLLVHLVYQNRVELRGYLPEWLGGGELEAKSEK
jgi:hypothetical protein